MAFDTDDNETAYLSSDLAREFGVLLFKYADNVEDCAFSDSALGTRYAGQRGEDDARDCQHPSFDPDCDSCEALRLGQ